ncbi:hypothetical protein GGR53DRAFT_463395 [Hypoxylon sp. FL1150]|nr:hypothetical protein GGR53DRAFT_463395 [Hypoxylon sp. FL1150]
MPSRQGGRRRRQPRRQPPREPLTLEEYQQTIAETDEVRVRFADAYDRLGPRDFRRGIIDTTMRNEARGVNNSIITLGDEVANSTYFQRRAQGLERRPADWIEVRGACRELLEALVTLMRIQQRALRTAGLERASAKILEVCHDPATDAETIDSINGDLEGTSATQDTVSACLSRLMVSAAWQKTLFLEQQPTVRKWAARRGDFATLTRILDVLGMRWGEWG